MSIGSATYRITSSLIALAAVSACSTTPTTSTPPTGFSAGGTSSHTAQHYETTTSTAAVTSTLGGSALVDDVASSTARAVATTGSVTHNTGRIALNDGTYLFVDANGPTATGVVTDGAGASGTVGANVLSGTFSSGYNYVLPYAYTLTTAAGVQHADIGFAGMITAAADMPNGGLAYYGGQSEIQLFSGSSAANDLFLSKGISLVTVDFGAGTAAVDLSGFTKVKNGAGVSILPSTATFNRLRGTGLTISGAHFTGGSWVTMKGGSVVNVVGASPTSTSNGTFFGYDPSISAPAEVAGVVVLSGSTASLLGFYAGR